MNQFTAKPENTFALVVGIEEYQENDWNVTGPANDAVKFANWLCVRGVPKANIRLCLSSLAEIEQTELEIQPATEQNIFDIITNFLSKESGDLLYIFWAGHGLITSERTRRLLCAEATIKSWQNIDFNSLLLCLSSDAFEIRNHICIVDACANYVPESQRRPTNLGGRIFSSGKPRVDSQQFVLLATRQGEKADVDGGKTGYFSQAVREALAEEPPEIYPPNMLGVAEKVKQRFASLDKQQLPTYYFYQTWDGDTNIFRPNPFDVRHNIPNSNARKFIGREQKLVDLHQLLQENNVVAITDETAQGGVGKTELALQYSLQHLEDYPGGCCWLYPEGSDIRTQLVEFAIVNFPNFDVIRPLSLDGQVAYCWRNWQAGKVLLTQVASYSPREMT